MSLAQRFERRLEGLVGGAFARVFKGQVEPVEIGTALQREATDRRNVIGNGQVLCPNRYRVSLSPSDHERLRPWESQLTGALAELLQEHLDENNWSTIGDVEVFLARDDELHTGVFGVASRMEADAPPRQRPHDSLSMPAYGGDGAARPAAPRLAAGQAALVVDTTSQRFDLRPGSNVVGRGSDSDLQLLDQGVSRRHIDVQFDGHRATVYDLGSTNGTTVNGHEVGSHMLRHGDVVRIGHTRMVFHQDAG